MKKKKKNFYSVFTSFYIWRTGVELLTGEISNFTHILLKKKKKNGKFSLYLE